ncbi:ABC-type transport auxiliary lipoprotein family protein [Arenimonas oryziterrae]|uniref:ABC-type transport auxiliary lipoprotein component domain-containing protein n=1 Tax=Arenimonas oryziterrae DSM 21050 = YC6267 TaxID=1121015 RepID=A0A091BGY2_9GAMM|nr:ABC-type transport auxiliary lipoprotein family protein [Arenimonas oryziterrae]KFN43635.1 hypothetical protein N789_10185 [Arenimonas oryziterrae DSM 21050 = YC6267]
MKALIALALAALLAGCSVLGGKEPVKVYVPRAIAADASTDWPKVDWSLLVLRPGAGQALDSERIAVRPEAGYIQVYKGAIWSDAAPDLVQNAVLRRLEDSGKILSVSRPGSGVRGEYQLVTELRAFESTYRNPGQPEAVIEVQAKLIHTTDASVVASRTFRDVQAAGSEDVPAVVEAFSQSLDRVATQLAGWALSNGQANARKKP